VLLALDVEIANRNGDRQRRRDQKDCSEDQGKPVDVHHSVKAIGRSQGPGRVKTKSAPHAHELGHQRGEREPNSGE
jgi:hypothetical protein